MSDFEDRHGNLHPPSWFSSRGIRPHRMDGLTAGEWRKKEKMEAEMSYKEGDPEYCPESPDHLHAFDPHSVQTADADADEGCIVDVSCKYCGRSGAIRIDPENVDW